ncbi:DUF2252 family protein [Cupriavidus consociatus]|uniref:DUF2252 family protein n=1 Tax=Cupriavidus consociatus TaxID=2821357 RepID=UPI001AE577B8|nr:MULTISPECIES: DUF2252 family protein [unclassified Cupriavidus]MBP0623235.1 DUF2252 family protein [Cupriavidus sp. LEh25]MDK2659928.1 DUF2252 family protein [Cupriavidus sp. LEh21]
MTPLMQDVSRYEDWLRRQCDVVEADLNYKHQRMLKGPHTFLRATYFRWAKRVKYFAANCLEAPSVLAVGDCHVENFGTWRDGEARQVWGVNDFDDAAVMPYTLDLVRLATSATLAQKREAPAPEVREAKALVPSSWDWARERKSATSRFISVATGAYRSPDPFLHVTGGFILRRVAPESRKLDLEDVTKAGRGPHLLKAMGHDVGSIHAAHNRTPEVLEHLRHMPTRWLVDCAERSTAFVLEDFNAWRNLVPVDDPRHR